jgi:hypothetical protein
MKIHRACISRLFEKNDLVLDVETIAEIGRETDNITSSNVERRTTKRLRQHALLCLA